MLRTQCRLFMVGSSFFAVGTAPGFAMLCGTDVGNWLCFVGSGFFTSAALIQMLLRRPSMHRSWDEPSMRAEGLSAMIQLFGTLNFNLSTGAMLWARRISARRHLVWWPDAAGSVAFLVSGALGVAAVTLTAGLLRTKLRPWLAAWTGMAGSIAFGASAVGAFITTTGIEQDAQLRQLGTFVGALCFFTAAFLRLPKRLSPRPARPGTRPFCG